MELAARINRVQAKLNAILQRATQNFQVPTPMEKLRASVVVLSRAGATIAAYV